MPNNRVEEFILQKVVGPSLMLSFHTLRATFRLVRKATRAVLVARFESQVRARHLPKSAPLIHTPEGQPDARSGAANGAAIGEAADAPSTAAAAAAAAGPTSFLHLPFELRLQIYREAGLYAAHGMIVQVSAIQPRWGPRPPHWAPSQHVRNDDANADVDVDGPSEAFRNAVGLGATGYIQHIPLSTRGCVRKGPALQMFCGEQDRVTARRWSGGGPVIAHPTDLMRSCRTAYADVLELLYGSATVSLVGGEMVRFFARNASPEGLARVRYVHLALHVRLDERGRLGRAQRRGAERAVRRLRGALPALRQLDVDVVLTWGQPEAPAALWRWVREDVLGRHLDGLGLERFVLSVSVLSKEEFRPRRDYEVTEEYRSRGWTWLSSWDDQKYEELRGRVMALGESHG
ncbi:hypothetical protein F4778DRAFT_781162 [Xylariomycetidae sp. FL2044]|nr:hypothetical protein F4778DRAFT_781162 [Xylariomycetidae sp. FL2044]